MSSKTLSIEISGTNYKLSDQEQDYIDRKCRKLVNHMPMHSRRSAFVSAKISLLTQPGDDKYQCDVVLTLPDKTLVASETATSVAAAIDIVERKLQGQIRKYKTERRKDGVNSGGIMAVIKRTLRRR
ncbi:ribosome-associated translation inhibitor RaiA [Candidatus Saccharibacteria bacterium]|jgi:ribosomal subunit interface protein|uniref:ribosome hibernation-promoting factor, HPF/YfiA family n=1 Tax=Candidatus Nanoperiomorbus periodonticus TaxID=2171989 RepID=UPI00101D8620|nr:ribosome-associated translation inhibitor RaiA [Candidatus Nanoperiomorbus periodonticus]MBB1556822.1 ribosome-associated translation inhibitor RaiA [Candidatus Saccharibacteria bacterium]MCG5079227.1 ribosome-associated translation inhibitor RaiA [Candidatus Saccharibacteria bacterium]MCG5106263.1 ribosome-associated translation inhibitor RaiA [Candidatus Saccharibacteria bacterium]RYC75289.1 Ribosome hibernation promotion factor [Candidatus Nanoperiomorbus periodonticus]RYC75688.1 Ribosom